MRIFPTNKPVIVITMGDPAGIGPEVIMGSLARPEVKGLANFFLVGDSAVLSKAACDAGVTGLENICPLGISGRELPDDKIYLIDPGPETGPMRPGAPSRAGAEKALNSIDKAVEIMKAAGDDVKVALVTGPVNKEMIASISPGFIGHTEYLRDSFGAGIVSMVFVGERLNAMPVTRHIPLADVPSALSVDLVADTIKQVADHSYLICERSDIKIGVAALNPHGGEGGKIGSEEEEIIRPAIEIARRAVKGAAITGPIPADVIFNKAINGELDIVVAMYHDQCLGPFKMIEFETGVNMTIGLGAVRTSPDHGTAFDIAGKGIADPMSMIQAIKVAVRAVKASK